MLNKFSKCCTNLGRLLIMLPNWKVCASIAFTPIIVLGAMALGPR